MVIPSVAVMIHRSIISIITKLKKWYNKPINPTAFSHLAFSKFSGWYFRFGFVVLSSSIN